MCGAGVCTIKSRPDGLTDLEDLKANLNENVAAVMGWAVEAVIDYVDNVRPRFGCADHPALWVTERGGRVNPAEINARFVSYRDAIGLDDGLTALRQLGLITPA